MEKSSKWKKFSIELPKWKKYLEEPIDLYAVFNSRVKFIEFTTFMFNTAIEEYNNSEVKSIYINEEKAAVTVDLYWMLNQIVEWICYENKIETDEVYSYIKQYFVSYSKDFDGFISKFIVLHLDFNLNVLQTRTYLTNQKNATGSYTLKKIDFYRNIILEDVEDEKIYQIRSIRFSLVKLMHISEQYELTHFDKILDNLINTYDHDALRIVHNGRAVNKKFEAEKEKIILFKFIER